MSGDTIKSNIRVIFPIFAVLLLTLSSIILRYRGYGVINQNIILPQIYRAADPSFLPQDWFVNLTDSEFNVRSYFKYFVVYTNIFNDLRINIFLIYSVFMFMFSYNIYKLSMLMFGSEKKAYVSLILVLFTGYISIGGIPVVDNYLVPSTMSYALALGGLYYYYSKKPILSGVFLGLSTLWQFLAGSHLLLAVAIMMLIEMVQDRKINKRYILSYLIMFVLALFTVVPYYYFGSNNQLDTDSLIQILGYFRSPHHFIPSKFAFIEYLQFYLLSIMGLVGLYVSQVNIKKNKIVWFYALVNIFFLLGYFFVEIIPLRQVFMLQLFRISIYLTIINYIIMGSIIVDSIKDWLISIPFVLFLSLGLIHTQIHRHILLASILVFFNFYSFKVIKQESKGVLFNLFLILLNIVFLPFYYHALKSAKGIISISHIDPMLLGLYILAAGLVIYFSVVSKVKANILLLVLLFSLLHSQKPIVLRTELPAIDKELYTYLDNNTPNESIFIHHPRSLYTLVSLGEKSQVVSWKLVPLIQSDLPEWKMRMDDVQKAYASEDLQKLTEVSKKYGATHIIFDENFKSPDEFGLSDSEFVKVNKRYSLMKIDD